MNKEYAEYIKWKEEQKKKEFDKIKKIKEFQIDLDRAVKDKEEIKKKKKLEDDKINYSILKQNEKIL